MVTLYHPKLKTTIEVSEASVWVHKEAGWTEKIPSELQAESTEAQASSKPATEGGK